MNAIQLIYLVPLLPLIGFLINGLGRNHLSKSLIGIIGSGTVLLSFCLSLMVFFAVNTEGFTPQIVHFFDFINLESVKIAFAFQVDQLTSLFLLIITGVGFLIHVYSTAYMHEESNEGFARYFAYLNLFVFSMLLLVLGSNYVLMYIGWEGVSLCSYLLIGFWFKDQLNNQAAKKAWIMNRIGDMGFLLAILWMLSAFGSVSYHDLYNGENGVLSLMSTLNTTDAVGISLLLFVGAASKSAQIPLYTWLPDAMAGPTPVSALIHAATMVTAGIYMVARSNVLYTLAPATLTVLAVIGLATAILAAIIATRQNDIKKVLAYSTVSQLGFMFLALGVGAYTAAVFHVMTHAFFKALLFLGAGSVIHAMGGEQDMYKMGGLRSKMKITYITVMVACLAIAGIPPLSGFFSKDEILNASFVANPAYYVLGLFAALLTAYYMFRMAALTFGGNFRGTAQQKAHLHENGYAITIPLIVLAVLSAVGGFIGIPEVFASNANWLNEYLSPVFAQSAKLKVAQHPPHSTEWILITVTTVLSVVVSIWAWNRFKTKSAYTPATNGFGRAVENKFYIDEMYHAVFVKPYEAVAAVLDRVIDKKVIDGVVNGVGRGLNYASRQVRLVQSGQVSAYLLLMVLGLLFFFIIQMFTK